MLVTVEVLKDHLSMRAGTRRQMSHLYAGQLAKGGVVRVVEDGVENKAVSSTPAKRGPGRAKKLGIDNKAVGA